MELVVELWKSILGVSRSISDVSNGGSLNDVSDNELLDGLILWAAASAVGAANERDVSAVLLVSSVVTSLERHCTLKLG